MFWFIGLVVGVIVGGLVGDASGAIILGFVGTKMILAKQLHIPNWLSLIVIIVVLAITITVSMAATRPPVVEPHDSNQI